MRTKLFILMCFSLCAIACGEEKKQPTAPAVPATAPGPAEAPATAVEPELPAAPAADTTDAAPAADDCVAACVQRNQMRAVAPEQIERDCSAECAK